MDLLLAADTIPTVSVMLSGSRHGFLASRSSWAMDAKSVPRAKRRRRPDEPYGDMRRAQFQHGNGMHEGVKKKDSIRCLSSHALSPPCCQCCQRASSCHKSFSQKGARPRCRSTRSTMAQAVCTAELRCERAQLKNERPVLEWSRQHPSP